MEDGPLSKHVNTNNLPLQLNRFIGRERELTAVRGLLLTSRPRRQLTVLSLGEDERAAALCEQSQAVCTARLYRFCRALRAAWQTHRAN